MSAGKRSDPGKLARDREAIRKSQESLNRPKFNPLQGLKDLDSNIKNYLGKKMQQNTERLREKAEGYGSRPLRNGAEEQTPPSNPYGAAVIGKKKRPRYTT